MISFNKTHKVFGAFSNFWDCPAGVRYQSILYDNAEAAFQAQKTTDLAEKLAFRHQSGSQAKKHGRRIQLRDDWDSVKYQIMVEILYCKFSQDPKLKSLLLSTGHEFIEENTTSWHDNEWGHCYCTRCVSKVHKNLLGKALMEVRDMLKDNKN